EAGRAEGARAEEEQQGDDEERDAGQRDVAGEDVEFTTGPGPLHDPGEEHQDQRAAHDPLRVEPAPIAEAGATETTKTGERCARWHRPATAATARAGACTGACARLSTLAGKAVHAFQQVTDLVLVAFWHRNPPRRSQ